MGPWAAFLGQERISYEPSFAAGVVIHQGWRDKDSGDSRSQASGPAFGAGTVEEVFLMGREC